MYDGWSIKSRADWYKFVENAALSELSTNGNSTRIYIETLRLDNFRNYQSLTISTDQRHVVLCGDNGAGKTNLLEAVSFLSPGRGMRRATYSDVAATTGNGSWAVNAELAGRHGAVNIGTGLTEGAGGIEPVRRIRINHSKVKSADELLDHCRVVWLAPSMDGLFYGPASDRRRFFDRLVLAIDPGHGRRVSNYEKSMRDRNKLLDDHMTNAKWLDSIEAQMSAFAAAIAIARVELALLLGDMIDEIIRQRTAFPDATIALDGVLENEAQYASALDLEDQYRVMLREGRALDRSAGRTLIGPHRSDLLVSHRPNNMPARLCSTGEQKALLVGIVLAHAKLVDQMSDLSPILLLDEVAAHLDATRRASLFDLLDSFGCQAWMSGTDVAMFAALGERAQVFSVSHGKLEKI